MSSPSKFGLSCALTTPFLANGDVDNDRLVAHAKTCLAEGCDSVTAFGTTGEGASFGLAERVRTMTALTKAGIDARSQIVACVSSASQQDALDQITAMLDANCRSLLLPPPFYFKNVSDDGLFAWFAGLFEKLGDRARDVILYNIPSVTAVALSVDLIGRLRTAFPRVITGVKDSSGDWPYTQALLAAHSDIAILIGDERHLAQGVQLGGQGAISGLANLLTPRLLPLVREGREDPAIIVLVTELLRYPVTPAVKALVALKTNDDAWRRTRPPLTAIPQPDAMRLGDAFAAIILNKAA